MIVLVGFYLIFLFNNIRIYKSLKSNIKLVLETDRNNKTLYHYEIATDEHALVVAIDENSMVTSVNKKMCLLTGQLKINAAGNHIDKLFGIGGSIEFL
ncbi:MAG: hypothetical protein ACJAS9_001446 [Polaribacter sp.]